MNTENLGVATLPFSLLGNRVLITGAAGGIGSATAAVCASMGAELVLVDIVDPSVTRERTSASASTPAFRCDLSVRSEVEHLAAEAGTIDVVIDAAAICPFDDWLSPDWDEAFHRVLAANALGPINLARAFQQGMIDRGGGRFVFCGSMAGWNGGLRSGPHYAFSKGGLHAFVRWLATRLTPHNVLVNAIAPGPTQTAMTADQGFDPSKYPLGRFASSEEMAGAIAFLASPASSFVSGAIIDVNGGIHFR